MDRQTNLESLAGRNLGKAGLSLNALTHPAQVYARPRDVVFDQTLDLHEKRAILASWASDACAIEAAPELRMTATGKFVRWDDVMEALRLLDEVAQKRGQGVEATNETTSSPWLAMCS